jgi:hypothetical protein
VQTIRFQHRVQQVVTHTSFDQLGHEAPDLQASALGRGVEGRQLDFGDM